MKKIICALIFCCFALIAAAQQFDIRKAKKYSGSPQHYILTAHNRESIYKRYNSSPTVGTCKCDLSIREKLHKELFDQTVTPEMRKTFNKEYAKSGKMNCQVFVAIIFEITTGKIIDVSFSMPGDFLTAFTEENVRKLYRNLLKTKINTAGLEYLGHQKELSGLEFTDFLKFALEEK